MDVYVLGGARTPVGKFGGSLQPISTIELGAHAVRESLRRAKVAAEAIDVCVVGMARQAGNGPNPGRLVALAADLPETTPAYTVQQACLSGMLAVISGFQSIRMGESRIAVAAGVEHMSHVPHLAFDLRWGTKFGNLSLVDGMYRDGFIDPTSGKHMGELCDLLAERYGLTRTEQDAYAAESQRRWAQARTSGAGNAILAPVPGKNGADKAMLEVDELPRPESTAVALAKLRAAFRPEGTVTAGNACGIADGSAALVLASEEAVKQLGVRPRVRIMGTAMAAVAPADYAIAPVASTRKLLASLDMKIGDFDHVEINEAFAAQMLACIQDLALDPVRVNPWGGAIAIGHPIGMSGTRVLLNVAHQLETLGGRFGLAAICGNGGQGATIALERVE